MRFFDGAAQQHICGCGFWLAISKELIFRAFYQGGRSTNIKAEVMALWGLLWFTTFLDVPLIHINGDLKVIIDHIMGSAKITNPLVLGWLARIELLGIEL